jgi:hypothetical protein
VRDLEEARGEHGPVGADDGGGEADDEEDEFFAPLGPLPGWGKVGQWVCAGGKEGL